MRAVIIGTGPAGITAAETLRREDPSGSVVALSTEPYAPYSPAAMADHFLTGRDDTLYWKGQNVAELRGIDERRESVVIGLDVDNREVVLHDDSRIPFEGLIIASGSKLNAPLEGADLPGIFDFKSLRMADELIGRVKRGEARSALIVGNGFIGVELSLLLADLGVDVTIIGRRPWIMPRVLDTLTAAVAQRGLIERGVKLHLGVEAEAFVGSPNVNSVRLNDGQLLEADLIVAATGVKPHIEFLHDSPIVTDWGIHVDDTLQTSETGIFASGDVAEARDWLTGERFVHAIFPNAVAQGEIAASNLLGANLKYDGAEAMNSLKHLGIPIVAMGTIDAPDEVLRWESGSELRSVYLRDDTIIGAQLAGNIRAAGVYRSLMLRRADVRSFGRGLVEPGFNIGNVLSDALVAR
ncbi:MAG TPA: FAD-dependent oxidoreductase [Acidimicrobiales bacterium]